MKIYCSNCGKVNNYKNLWRLEIPNSNRVLCEKCESILNNAFIEYEFCSLECLKNFVKNFTVGGKQ